MNENFRRKEFTRHSGSPLYYVSDGEWNLLLNFREELSDRLSKAVEVCNQHSGDNGIKLRITDEAPWWNAETESFEDIEDHRGLWVNVSVYADLRAFWLVAEALCDEPFVDTMCGHLEISMEEGTACG